MGHAFESMKGNTEMYKTENNVLSKKLNEMEICQDRNLEAMGPDKLCHLLLVS